MSWVQVPHFAMINVSCLYPQCSVTVAREIVALLEKVRLLPCGPLLQNGRKQGAIPEGNLVLISQL